DDAARFAVVTLDEPSKEAVTAFDRGEDPPDRRARLVVVPGPECSVIEVRVSLASGDVSSLEERHDVRPALLFEESFNAIVALHDHAGWRAAMHRRGITDLDKVQIDPWPTGNFGVPAEEGRRIARCLFFYREDPTDNGYARPIEGVLATVDMARGEVLEVFDYGTVPLPPEAES
ncbi:MAG: tyramine oxidase, partial [Actinomycetota bacterium]|nr:tyramine oxidase [Actinomycetota bacterium]